MRNGDCGCNGNAHIEYDSLGERLVTDTLPETASILDSQLLDCQLVAEPSVPWEGADGQRRDDLDLGCGAPILEWRWVPGPCGGGSGELVNGGPPSDAQMAVHASDPSWARTGIANHGLSQGSSAYAVGMNDLPPGDCG